MDDEKSLAKEERACPGSKPALSMEALESCSLPNSSLTCTLLSRINSKSTLEQKHYELKSYLQEKRDELVAELLDASHYEARMKSKTSRVEAHEQQNAFCGLSLDVPAALVLLHNALSIAKTMVTKFQRVFEEAIRSDPIWVCGTMYQSFILVSLPDQSNLIPDISFAVKSTISEIFFEGFENVSFNTSCWASRFVDPNFRQVKFYLYYLRAQDRNDARNDVDPQYEEFCERKVSLLLGDLPLRKEIERVSRKFKQPLSTFEDNGENVTLSCLAALGGAELLSSFQAATRSVWLLHKLAFSFEPPASILRVATGADFDPNYMHSVGNLSDSMRFVVPTVHCMVAPGLRLQGTIFRGEVILR